MTKRVLFIFLFLLLLPVMGAGAPQPRPFTGIGLLIVRHFNPAFSSTPLSLTLYREPGVGRIGERPVTEIPLLSSLLSQPANEYPVAVMGKKGNWMLVAYDDAGREGWVEMSRWWVYCKWDDFLKGRSIRLLSGLKKERHSLHMGPSDSTPQTAELAVEETLRVIEVDGEWLLALTTTGLSGWISWRDGDGRFLISVGDRIDQQKH